jgi:hypothetical protein
VIGLIPVGSEEIEVVDLTALMRARRLAFEVRAAEPAS